ncbi:MAG TPA: hypothetical protein VGB96_14625 [Archangium sp.]
MNLRRIGLGTGAALFASSLAGCGALQQDPQCVVAKGTFATVYTPRSTTTCTPLKPEVVGLEKYFTEDPAMKDTVALRVRRVGDMMLKSTGTSPTVTLDPDAPLAPHSVGEMTEVPGPDNFCEVPSLGATQLVARTPALSLTYAWSNLRVYNTAEIPGTQFTADLTYTENGCTADYKVKGIWPVVSCATGGKPDETKCDPKADPSVGRLRGSGINPSFAVKCDPNALICVLKDPSAAFP